MSALFREQLLAAAGQAAFPAERTLDPATGEEVFDAASEAMLAQLFALFGITALNPQDDDADKVINTACTLATEVTVHLQGLISAGGALDTLEDAGGWHPAYRAYISALWQGDRAEVARCAQALQLSAGIPNGSLPLEAGPLA
jgi:hypothetical protein